MKKTNSGVKKSTKSAMATLARLDAERKEAAERKRVALRHGITVYFDPDAYAKLAILAAENKVTLEDVAESVITKLLAKTELKAEVTK